MAAFYRKRGVQSTLSCGVTCTFSRFDRTDISLQNKGRPHKCSIHDASIASRISGGESQMLADILPKSNLLFVHAEFHEERFQNFCRQSAVSAVNRINSITFLYHKQHGESGEPHSQFLATSNCVTGTVQFSHTRYRALGPELIPMYRQSARR